MQLIPLGDRIVIKQKPPQETTASGIALPQMQHEDHSEGTILALGPTVPPTLAEGDDILFTKFAGSEVKIDQQTFVIIRERDVLAKRVPPPLVQGGVA